MRALAVAEEGSDRGDAAGAGGGGTTEEPHRPERIGRGDRLPIEGRRRPRLRRVECLRNGDVYGTAGGGIHCRSLVDERLDDRLRTLLDELRGSGRGHGGDIGSGGHLRRDADDVGDAPGRAVEDGAGGATGAEVRDHGAIHDPLG